MTVDHSADRSLHRLVLLGDGLLVAASLGAAFALHGLLRAWVPALKAPPALSTYAELGAAALPLWLLCTSATGAHRVVELAGSRRAMLGAVLRTHVLLAVALAVLLFVTQARLNRTLVALFLGSSATLTTALRFIVHSRTLHAYQRGHGRQRLLVVGAPGPLLEETLGALAARPLPPEVVGVLGDASDAPLALGGRVVPALGPPERLAEVLHAGGIDQVLIFPPWHGPEAAASLLGRCEEVGVPAHVALELHRPHAAAPRLVRLAGRSFVTYELAPKAPAALALKHGIDLVGAAVLLVLLAPLLLLTALAILLTMGRPLLFSQERAGIHGRPFRMLKFRTMVVDAERQRAALLARNQAGGPTFKLDADPRVTPLGRLLRRFSVDELPQLFNVLGGTMSLVGPRPLPVDEQQQIRGWHRRRLSMKPGLTCLWQVSGRSQIGFEQWMALDLRYIDGWSLRLDLELLLRTVPAVLFGRGAW